VGRIFCKLQCVPMPEALERNEVLKEKYGKLRRFYDCSGTYNDVVSYIEHGARLNFGLYEDFNGGVKTGIFDNNGVCDSEKLKMYQEKLRKTNSPIWGGIILFPEEFGLEYVKTGYDAKRIIKESFSKFFKGAGFAKDNVEWFAGLHENYVRKHIHFVIWEKKPLSINRDTGEKEFSSYFIQPEVCREFEENLEKSITSCAKEIDKEIVGIGTNKLKENFNMKKNMLELFRILPDVPFSNNEELKILRYKNKLLNISRQIIRSNKDILEKIGDLSTVLREKEKALEEESSIVTKSNLGDEYFELFYEGIMKEALREIYKRKKQSPSISNKTIRRREMKEGQIKLMKEFKDIKENLNNKALKSLDWLICIANEIDPKEILIAKEKFVKTEKDNISKDANNKNKDLVDQKLSIN